MPRTATDWTGYRYSYLTVIGPTEERDAHGRRKWRVHCDCGREKNMDIRDIREREKAGRPISCGCMKKAFISAANTTHGMTGHSAYGVWHSMIQRCTEPSHPAWKNYGGRGITVCDRWRHSFENFWADMGASYERGKDLDRIDNEAGYSPENCRWATRATNCRNKRGARRVTISGKTVPLMALAQTTGIGYTTLLYRLDHGCPLDKLTAPPDTRNRFTT